MKKQIITALLLALSLLISGIFSSSVLAEQKHEEISSKPETSQQVSPPDHTVEIFNNYFAMRELLAQDKVDQLGEHAREMSTQLGNLIQALGAIREKAANLKADNLEEARKGFAPLSESVLSYVKDFGFSGKLYSFYCPMMKESWLQENDQIGNPYYGTKMSKCGDITGMTMNGKYVGKAESKSESPMYMKRIEGK
jgi:hypothetical protein